MPTMLTHVGTRHPAVVRFRLLSHVPIEYASDCCLACILRMSGALRQWVRKLGKTFATHMCTNSTTSSRSTSMVSEARMLGSLDGSMLSTVSGASYSDCPVIHVGCFQA